MTVLRYTLLSTAIDLIYTPVWWYTSGAVYVAKWFTRSTRATWNMLSIGVWMKHIFTPMFQQYDWQGRVISFFMRVVQIIARSCGLGIMILIYATLAIAWFIVPIAVVYIAFQNMLNAFTTLV